MNPRIVLIDNVDSFSYNLVDELRQLNYDLVVYRNQVSAATVIDDLTDYSGPQILCLSPGPGHPSDAGNLLEVMQFAKGHMPMLGICLGFQALIELAGGRVARCGEVVHGKTATMSVSPHPIFNNLASDGECVVARYHSLSGYDLPASIQVIGQVHQIPMAAEFSDMQAIGFQFHPESLLTPQGKAMLANSIDYLLKQTVVANTDALNMEE